MTERDAALARECDTFSRFLVGERPTEYVVDKYLEAHRVLELEAGASAFDRSLLRWARGSRWGVKMADAYAAAYAPQAVLRKKLVTLLAILETCPPTFRAIDEVPAGKPPLIVARLALQGVSAAVAALAGVVVFLPLHLLLSGGRKQGSP